MEQFLLETDDNTVLAVHTFDVEQPRAVVQIIHGMEEHQERYEGFATFLNSKGYSVVTSDLRGHGMTAKDLGHFKNKNGHIALISDQIKIRDFIDERYDGLPVYLFAHSMGTIISRVLLQTQSQRYQRVVLSGYPYYQTAMPLGVFLTDIIRLLRGPKYKSGFIQKISIGVFNKKIPDAKTDVDWVCANEATIRAYIDDPYCGIGFTCSAFNDLYHLMIKMHKPELYKNVNSDMQLLMLRGIDDPCTGGETGTADSIEVLKRAGFNQIRRIDYPDMRHEILNEKDYQIVYNDVADFFGE